MDTLFEIPPARRNVHACTGPECSFCAFVNGREARKAGTDAVKFDPRWRIEANEWRRSMKGRTVTADDLVDAIGLPDGSPNQIGALFRKWASMGMCRQRGQVSSARKSNHARRVIMWEVTA